MALLVMAARASDGASPWGTAVHPSDACRMIGSLRVAQQQVVAFPLPSHPHCPIFLPRTGPYFDWNTNAEPGNIPAFFGKDELPWLNGSWIGSSAAIRRQEIGEGAGVLKNATKERGWGLVRVGLRVGLRVGGWFG